MGRLLLPLFLACLCLLTRPAEAGAQNQHQQAKLFQLSKAYSIQFQREKAAALKRADSLGIPTRLEFKNGRVVELRKFVNGRPVYITTFNADGAALIKTNEVYSGGGAGLNLTGNNQTLGIWDFGLPRLTHQEFGGRVFNSEEPEESPPMNNSHASRVAGTMIASGQFDSNAKGMAFNADLNSYDWDDDHGEMAEAALAGLLLSVHPYGYEAGWDQVGSDWYWHGDATETEDFSFGFYDPDFAKVWDEIAFNAPNYLIIAPAGNQRGITAPQDVKDAESFYVFENDGYVLCSDYDNMNGCNNNYEDDGGSDGFDSISYNALAKNVFTVGSVDTNEDLSSDTGFGPTDDGRIKPDIVAKGVDVYSTDGSGDTAYSTGSGTSSSAPMIGGSVGLLLEHQENLHPGITLLSSTLKALVLHTAKDLGNTGPDYKFGWGLMDTQKAAEVMSLNNTEEGIHIKELTLHDGETISFPVQATGSEPLRVTIAWTDPPGSPPTHGLLNPIDLMLVNDLDMQLENESSTVFQPYVLDPLNPGSAATTGDNSRDNVEMVHIESPATDEVYTITITHKNSLSGGSQDFSLIITGNEGVDYQQQITEGNGEGWRFLSSPVVTSYQELLHPLCTQGATNSDYPSTSESNVLVYDGTNYVSVDDLAATMDSGSGLAIFVYEDDDCDSTPDGWPKTVTVNGMEILNDVDVSDLLNPGNEIFTLLGNPFHSTIDFDGFTNLSQVGGTVYVYDHSFEPDPFVDPDEPGGDSGGSFRAWNGDAGSLTDGLISSFQGFFVYATGNSPTLTIPTTAKTGASSTFYKEKEPVPAIQIAAQLNGKYSADTWFSFTETGSLEMNSKDAPYLYPLGYKPFLSVRSETDGLGYLIKNLPVSITQPLKVPVSIEAWQPDENAQSPGYEPMDGSVEIVWPNLQNIPENWTITLADHQNGSVVDLEKTNRYTFNISDQKGKAKTLPYSMKMKAADETSTTSTRFTLTIYPEPLADNRTQETPSEFSLEQNYPNPFNPSTVIRYNLPEASGIELEIYTIDGQKVATLVNESQSAGNHTVTFDGSNLSSGVYIYKLTTGRHMVSKKMVLIK